MQQQVKDLLTPLKVILAGVGVESRLLPRKLSKPLVAMQSREVVEGAEPMSVVVE